MIAMSSSYTGFNMLYYEQGAVSLGQMCGFQEPGFGSWRKQSSGATLLYSNLAMAARGLELKPQARACRN